MPAESEVNFERASPKSVIPRAKRFPTSLVFDTTTTIFNFTGLRYDIYGSIKADNDFKELRKHFKTNYKELSTNYNAIIASFEAEKNVEMDLLGDTLSNLDEETQSLLLEIQHEMKTDFQAALTNIRNLKLSEELRNLVHFLEYYWSNIDTINGLSENMRETQLETSGEILFEIKNASSTHGTLMKSINHIIDEKLAYPKYLKDDLSNETLYILYSSIQTYVSMLYQLLEEYALLANFHYEQGSIEKCNDYFDKLRLHVDLVKHALLGKHEQRGLIEKVLGIIDEVSALPFSRYEKSFFDALQERKATLKQAEKCIQALRTSVTAEQPEMITHKPDFEATKVETPLGDWRDGLRVSYAVQYEKHNSYSKISDWSIPITIAGKACPLLTIPIDAGRSTRILYRKFDNGKPQYIGAIEDVNETIFSDIDRDLYIAAGSFDERVSMDIIETLLRNGADINADFELGRKPIHAAAQAGNINLARKFLLGTCSGVDLNAQDKNGNTALHLAAEIGYDDFVELLIENEANKTITNSVGQTALHVTALNGYEKVLKVLLKNSTDKYLNAADRQGLTALHAAVFGGLTVVEELLLQESVDINAKSNSGFTALQLAVLHEYRDIAVSLLKHEKLNINAVTKGNFTALHFAAMLGNADMLHLLCGHNSIDLNAAAINDWTALHYAVSLRHLQALLALLNCNGVNVNAKAVADITPLHLAAEKGAEELVLPLLEKGALVEAQTTTNYTALHLAALEGHLDTVMTLIAHNASIEATTQLKYTPLLLTASSKRSNTAVLKYLVEKGANMTAVTTEHEKPIFLASETGNVDMVSYLIKNFRRLHFESSKYGSVLHYAIRGGNLEVLKYLIEAANLDVNYRNNNDETPLCIAKVINDKEIIDYLSTKQATFDEVVCKSTLERAAKMGDLNLIKAALERRTLDAFDITTVEALLRAAVKTAQWNVIEYLVELKADLNSLDDDGKACLHYAIESSDLALIKYLIQNGADVNAVEKVVFGFSYTKRKTPLHLAVEKELEIVKILIENGAKLEPKDSSHNTPLHVALLAATPRFDIIKYLVENGAPLNAVNNLQDMPLHLAALIGLKLVKVMIENGADVSAVNLHNETALHLAVSSHAPDMALIKYLVEKGTPVNVKNGAGQTALHIAVEKTLEIVKYLIENGADITAKDTAQDTPLHYACNSYAPNLEVIKFLLEKGAPVNAKGKEGKTPLHHAAEKSVELAKLLIEKGADNTIGDEQGNLPIVYSNFESLRGYLEPKNRLRRGIKPLITNSPNEIAPLGFRTHYKTTLPAMELTYKTQKPENAQSIGKPQTLFNAENLAFIACLAETLDDSASRRYQRLKHLGVNVIPDINFAVYDAHERFYEFVEEKIATLDEDGQADIRVELHKVDSDIVESLRRGVEFSGLIGLDQVLMECKKCFEKNLLKKIERSVQI